MTTKVFSFTIACLRVALFFTFMGNANGNFSNDVSGGMFNQQSSPSVTNCSFFSNSATNISEGATDTFPLTVTELAYSQALFSGTTNVSVGTMPPSVANRDFNGNGWPDFAAANIFSATAPAPAIIYVRASAAGANNGTSWANAYTSFQSALDAAVSGDEIWVAAGTYTPTKDISGNASPADPRTKNFYINKDLKIYGGFEGTESSLANRPTPLAASILSGDLGTVGVNTDNAYHCVFIQSVSAASIFDGFTLQDGNANHPSVTRDEKGGGMFCWISTGNSISNCTFTSNQSFWGGGMICESSSTPVITNCHFLNNTASIRGGGLFALVSDALVYNCTFTGNSCSLGSAIFNENSAVQEINCSVSGNTGSGGAIANFGSTPVITNTIVWGNSSQITNYNSTNPTITYCIVQGGYSGAANSSQDPLFISSSDLHLQSCSPAIDAGNDGVNTTTGDPDFNARKFEAVPGGAQIDRGAYEYQITVLAPVASCTNVSVNLNGSGTVSVNASSLNNTSTGCGLGFTVGGNASVSYNCTNTGPNTATLTVTDLHGRTSTCDATVTVVDQTVPSIICPANTNVVAGVNCTATLASYTGAATANDNCTANPNKMQSPVTGTTITGSQVVTLTATDGANNSTACTFTVTVVDQTAPSIICPANTNVVAGANCTAALASYTATATANDNCTANPTKVQSPVAGTTIAGSQIVTLTATDGANNSATCTFTVTVVDQTAPSITCPANTTVLAGANCTAALASYTAAATANDNCTANPTKVQSPVAGTTIAGSQIVTLTATDGANNSATCSFTVTVVDATPPTVICKNFTANLNTTGTASITTANVFQSGSDNCGNVNLVNVVPNTFTCANIGASTVVLTVSDGSSNTATCSAIVTVADATVPTIICPANIIRANDLNQCSASVVYATPIASDNCAGAVASHFSGGVSGAVFQKGTTTVVWRATDGVGLTGSCSFTITINDTQKPNITCPANQTRSTDPGLCSAVVTYPMPKGTDNCGLPTEQPVWISGGTAPTASGANSIATFQKGINTVTWRATDGAGLTNTCTFRVTVNDNQAPTMTCPAAMNLFTATNTCNATATYTNPTFTDNCAPTTGTATRISGLVSGSTFPLGNSNVVFQATDAAGNTRRCTMVVTVTDNQPPVITCPAPVVVNGTGSPCVATVFYGSATASDNCAGTLTPFLVTGLASGSSFPVGVTTNTFRAVAPNGQSSSCSFAVTVNCGNGMGNTGTEVRDADLEIQQNSNLNLAIAPNPALSIVIVSIEGVGAGGGTLLVFDQIGRLVQQQVIASDQRTSTLQVAEFAPGLYRVMLRTDHGMVTKTLVVVKE